MIAARIGHALAAGLLLSAAAGSGSAFAAAEIVVEQPAGSAIADGDQAGFGLVPILQFADRSFTVRNTGDADLTGLAATIDGPQAAQFQVIAAPAATVAPGGSTSFVVRYTAGTTLYPNAALHLASNDADENPFDIGLTGVSGAPDIVVEQPAGSDVASGATRSIGSAIIGQTRTLDFGVRNAGLASLSLLGTPRLTVGGANAGDFSVPVQPVPTLAAAGIANPGFESPPLGAGAFLGHPLGAGWMFSGSAGIARNGSPWFGNAAPNGAQAAYLQIRTDSTFAAISGPLVCAADGSHTLTLAAVHRSFDYPAVNVDIALDGTPLGRISADSLQTDTWADFPFTFACTAGPHTLTLSSSDVLGSDNATAIDNLRLAGPTAATSFRVAFTPTAAGSRAATLTASTNDPDEGSFTINVTGTGQDLPDIAIDDAGGSLPDGSERDFGAVAAGGTLDHAFTVRNTGSAPLTGIAASFEGADAATFSLLVAPPTSLAAGASASFTVRYNATTAAAVNAVLHLSSNDPDETPYDLVLRANLAVDIEVEHDGTRLANGATVTTDAAFNNEGVPIDFRIRNASLGALQLGPASASISGPNAADFTVVQQPDPTVGNVGFVDFGFEMPALAAGNYQEAPSGSGWQFSGIAGVAANGSPWFVNPAPEGTQALYLQAAYFTPVPGAASHPFACPSVGSYRLRYSWVQRGGGHFAPNLAVRVDDIDIGGFASVPASDTWNTQEVSFDCTSVGMHVLTFASIFTGGNFDRGLAIDDIRIYGPGVSTRLRVSFSPSALGTRQATLAIASNDPDESPFQIQLTGGAVPADIAVDQPALVPAPSGSSRDFGAIALGQSAPLSFTLENRGGFPLNLTGTPRVAISGTDAADFSVTQQPTTPLAPTVHIRNPSFASDYSDWRFSGNAQIVGAGFDDSHSGLLATCCSIVSAIEQTLNIPTAGTYTLRFELGFVCCYFRIPVNVRLDGVLLTRVDTFDGNFDWVTYTTPMPVATPGQHVLRFETDDNVIYNGQTAVDDVIVYQPTPFVVNFSPSGAGPRNATLTIASDDPDEGTYQIALTGTGTTRAEVNVEQPLGTDLPDAGSRSFGTVSVGSSKTLDFSISNRGSETLLLGGSPRIAVAGADAADFSITEMPAASLAPATPLTVVNPGFETPVLPCCNGNAYRPDGAGWTFNHFTGIAALGSPFFYVQQEGNQAAFLQTQEDDDTEPSTIAQSISFPSAGDYLLRFKIVGRTDTPANTVEVRLDGNFIGRVRASSQSNLFWHDGTVSFACPTPGPHTLSFTGVLIDGDRSSSIDDVHVDGPITRSTFRVTFTPSTAAPKVATLRIPTNDTDENPFDIALDGTGAIAPEIGLEQPADSAVADGGSRSFGNVALGASADLVFTVRNSGSADLTGLGLTIDAVDAAQFAVVAAPTAPLAAGASTTFTVRFTPASSGSKHAALHLASNDADENPYDLLLDGTGIAAAPEIGLEQPVGSAVADGGSRGFGSVAIGSTADLVFTVRNSGSADLTGLGLSIDGGDAARFSVLTATSPPVAPGASTTFTLRYAPIALGASAAAVHLTSNDADENPYDIALSGTGVAAPADLAVSNTNGSATLSLGNDTVYTIEVRNNGPATVSSVHVVDALPLGLTNAAWLCTSSPPALCPAASGTGGIDQTTVAPLASGALLHYELAATVDATVGNLITNTATVSGLDPTTIDPTPANDTASDSDPVAGDVVFANGFE